MNGPWLLIAAILSAIAALASLVGLLAVARQRVFPKSGSQADDDDEATAIAAGPLPYRQVEALLSPSERALHSVLRPIAETEGAAILAKVHLGAVVQVRRGAQDYETHVGKIDAHRIDFLLCEMHKLVPLLAVQMDGGPRADDREHDRFLAQTLAAVGLPLLRIPVRASYEPEEISVLVAAQLSRGWAPPAAATEPDSTLPPYPASPSTVPTGLPPAEAEVLPAVVGAVPAIAEQESEQPSSAHTVAEPVPSWLTPPDQPAVPALVVSGPDVAAPSPVETQVPALAAMGPDSSALEPAAGEGEATDCPPALAAADERPSLCPSCGRPLVEMQDVDTGEVVLACQRYPECQYYRTLPS